MPQLSIKDQVKKLVELQKIDGAIYELKKSLEEKPRVLEGLQRQFEEKKARLKELEGRLKGIQLKRKEAEVELAGKEGDIKKSNADLSKIKTNKEYTAKIHEIESLKADQSIVEEKILVFFEDADKVNAEIAKEKQFVVEEEKKFQAAQKQFDEEMQIAQDRIKVLEAQRKQYLPDIDPNVLNRYTKLLAHKEGLAIVPVQGSACGGCFMNLTTQIINHIKMHESLEECEKCSRILYIKDQL